MIPVDWVLLIFFSGVLLGLLGRPLIVKLFRLALGAKKQLDDIKKEANDEDRLSG